MHAWLIWTFALCILPGWVAAQSAAILYPTDNDLTFNYIDEVTVSYTTPWPSGANLTLWCYGDPGESTIWYWAFYEIAEGGTFLYHGIGTVLQQYINQYPVLCWLDLFPYQDTEGVGIIGGNFTMTSVIRAANTFPPATSSTVAQTTLGAPFTPTATSVQSSISADTDPSNLTTSTPTASSGYTSIYTSVYTSIYISTDNSGYLSTYTSTFVSTRSSATSSSPPASSTGSQSAAVGGLSMTAKIGISVGVGVIILIILAAVGYLIRKRRRNSHTQAPLTQGHQPAQLLQPHPFPLNHQEEKIVLGYNMPTMYPRDQTFGRTELPPNIQLTQRQQYYELI